MQIPLTAACAALCGLLIVFLAARVSRLRLRHRVSLGDGGIAELAAAIRSHGNTVEFVPIFLLLTLCQELYAGADPLLLGLALVFLSARLLLAVGLARPRLQPLRTLGAALSYLTLTLQSLWLLVAVVTTI